MCHVLAAELCSETDLVSLLEKLLLKLDVTECASRLVTGGREAVIIMSGGQLYREKVLLGRGSSDYEGDMIWRAGCGSEALHLGHEERNESSRILNPGLGLLIEIALVGRAASLGDHQETVLVTLNCLDVDLRRKVAFGVHLIVHVERSILGIAEILLGIGLEHSERERLLILEAGPYLLALLAVDDGCTGILAERELALCGHFSIAEEGQGHVFVIGRGLRV